MPATPSAPESAVQPTRARYIVLALVASLSAICFIERATISQAAPDIEKSLGITKGEMGVVFSAFTLSYALFEIPMGRWGDRFGPRNILLKVVLMWSFFTAATGWVWNLTSLKICRLLFGAGEGGCFPNLTKIVTIWLPSSERGRAQGILWCCGRWGAAIAPSIMAFTLLYLNWRWAFTLLSLLGVIWAVIFYFWFSDRPRGHPDVNAAELALMDGAESNAPSEAHVPWGEFIRRRSVWLLWLTYFCMAYGWYFYITWLPTYLRESRHMDLQNSAFLAGLPTFMGGLGCFAGGWLVQYFAVRWGDVRRARRTVAGGAMLVASVTMVIFTGIGNNVLAVAVLGFASFCEDLVMASAWGACMDIGGRHAGALSGSMNMMGNLGGVVGPMVVGTILQNASLTADSIPTPHAWTLAFLITATVYLLGATCWIFIDPATPLEKEN
jgi:MFS family permease